MLYFSNGSIFMLKMSGSLDHGMERVSLVHGAVVRLELEVVNLVCVVTLIQVIDPFSFCPAKLAS